MPEMMKCFVMHGIAKVGMTEKPVPRPGPSDAIIRTMELENTKVTGDAVEVKMDETKRNYLHPVPGSDAAKIGAGLFTKLTN